MVIYAKNMMEAVKLANTICDKITEEGLYVHKYFPKNDGFIQVEYWSHLPRWINIGEDQMCQDSKPMRYIVKMPKPATVLLKEADYDDWRASMKK